MYELHKKLMIYVKLSFFFLKTSKGSGAEGKQHSSRGSFYSSIKENELVNRFDLPALVV